jgi:hypothetical protein
METFDGELPAKRCQPGTADYDQISENHKEFNVKLIEGYRTRGHLFTKKIPKRQKDFEPSLTSAILDFHLQI